MTKIETDVTYIKKELVETKQLVRDLSDAQEKALAKQSTKMDTFIDTAQKRFADKRTELIVYALCAILLIAVVRTLLINAGIGG